MENNNLQALQQNNTIIESSGDSKLISPHTSWKQILIPALISILIHSSMALMGHAQNSIGQFAFSFGEEIFTPSIAILFCTALLCQNGQTSSYLFFRAFFVVMCIYSICMLAVIFIAGLSGIGVLGASFWGLIKTGNSEQALHFGLLIGIVTTGIIFLIVYSGVKRIYRTYRALLGTSHQKTLFSVLILVLLIILSGKFNILFLGLVLLFFLAG